MADDDFFIPTGEEIDKGVVPRKPHRTPATWFRKRRKPLVAGRPRQVDLEVPESVGRNKTVQRIARDVRDGEFVGSGSTGRVVRAIGASERSMQREQVIPPELRDNYGLDQ